MKAIGIGYHDVDDGAPSHDSARPGVALYTIKRKDFRIHLQCIQQQGASISTIEHFRGLEGRVPTLLTFDDGSMSAYSYVASELEKHGWRGHFFITTDWIGRAGFLDRRQICELRSRGHIIGSHSCSHPARMSSLGFDQIAREWAQSCKILGEILGEPVTAGSVPDGYYSRKVGKAAAAVGLQVLFTSEATASASIQDGCLVLGRYFICRNTPPAISGAVAAGHIWPRWRQTVVWNSKKSVKALTGDFYLSLRRYLLSHRFTTEGGR